MKYVPLGRSGLIVSRLCLGCMSFGTPKWRPWVLDEDQSRPIIRRALESGINFFDTADMYSLGVSEEVTGRALREMAKPDEIVLATKVFFPMGDRPNQRGLSRKHIVQACEASLRRLGVERIDLYQIHRFDWSFPIEETLAALDQLVRQGKVLYLGASSGYAWEMARALSIQERERWTRFISMQNHYNLLYREEEREMIPLCVADGVGVNPWSPLARGLLARPWPAAGVADTARDRSDAYTRTLYDAPSDKEVVHAVQRAARARDIGMAEVALAWLLGRPSVVAPVIGVTKIEHLDSALRAVDLTLTEDECRSLESPYRPHEVKGLDRGPRQGGAVR
ncbi:MAG TPA: aldo/keto reductase [Gemmatimonadaceae bacterium]|nr:aldo/keto reductase [Gemmatimonadaceae bacterium]